MKKSLTGLSSVILAMHAGLAAALAYAATHCPLLLGPAVLAYGLGLRHAVDADHIAAIDNTVRRLMQDGQKPYAVGFFFALGHSTIVFCVSLMVALSSSFIAREMPAFKEAGATIGTLSSSLFLILIGAINLFFLRETFLVWRRSLRLAPGQERQEGQEGQERQERQNNQREDAPAAETSSAADSNFGLLNKLLKPVMQLVNGSNKMFFVGLLFGLGFDTASEVTFLTLTATSASAALAGTEAVSPWAMLILPLAFTAGMTLIDSIDGVLMLSAYGWAFLKPTRKLFYNLTITATSVLIAFTIAAAQISQYISQNFQNHTQISVLLTAWHFQDWGLYCIAIFVALWLGSVSAAKMAGRKTLNTNTSLMVLFFTALSSTIVPTAAQAAEAAKNEKTVPAINFVQTHYFFGSSKLTLAEKGLKIENTGNFRFVLIARAPDWKVTVYRNDEKLYFSESLSEFESTGLVNNFLIAEKPTDFDKYGPYKSTIPMFKYPVLQVRTAWCTLKTFPLKKYAYRIPLETIVHAAYRMPTSGGVTLDFCAQGTGQDFFTSDRKRHYQSETYFSTEKISPTEVTAASFEIPKGLKKAASLREVVSGAEVRREGEEFLIESSKKNK